MTPGTPGTPETPGPPEERGPRIVIGIPTFRRPDLLATLLDTLLADLADSVRARRDGVRVVVADNDSDPATRDVVAAHLPGIDHEVISVATPGISAVRNALAAHLLGMPGAQWLVMLDDDGQVLSPWLDVLLDCAERFDADLIAGPVLGSLPDQASRLARNSLFGGRRRLATGRVPSLNGAQNLAVHRRALEAMAPLWFDPALGRCGGEDYEFFRYARALDLTLVWCDEAPVLEPTPASRVTTPAILRRVFHSNRVGAHIDSAYDGPRGTIASAGEQCFWALKAAGAGMLRREPDRFYEAALKAVGVAGRATALAQYAVHRVPPLARGRYRR